MKNMKCIHETIIRDVVDIVQGFKGSDEVQKVKNFKNGGSWSSIASKAEALTLVFPVLASRNISYETGVMISKAIERKAIVMLQMLFTAINISDASTAFDYVAKFHNNLDSGNLTVDKFIDAMDSFVEENTLINEAAQYEAYEKIKKDLQNIDYHFELSNVNEDSLNSYKIINIEGSQLLINEAIKGIPNNRSEFDPNDKKVMAQSARDYSSAIKNYADTNKNYFDMEGKRLLDGDVKKANELVPTMMYINWISKDDGDNNLAIHSHAVIGIKAKLYAIDSQDIINRLKLKRDDSNGLLNLIKAGTREISFLKDFIFAIDKAKLDALSKSNRGSSNKIWKVLERRALKSRIKRSMMMENDAAAISTLVISQEEVEYLKKTEYLDAESPKVMNHIMNAYNLMSFVIVDESLEIAKFLFDTGDDMYEILTFNNLERETRDNTKKIVNLMSKISR